MAFAASSAESCSAQQIGDGPNEPLLFAVKDSGATLQGDSELENEGPARP